MERDEYWDIVKGLGIIAIVIGHTNSPLTPFVYMYHLALFFFISGFLYKDKYSIDFFSYWGSRMKRLWYPMVKYGVLFSILHNLYVYMGLYSSGKPILGSGILFSNYYTKKELLFSIKDTVFMQSLEPMAGAMWFISPLLIAMLIFCAVRRITINLKKYREVIVGVVIVIIYSFAIILIREKQILPYHADLAMLVMPIIYSGFVAAKYWGKIRLNLVIALLSLFTVVGVNKIMGMNIELSIRQIISPEIFLLVSLCGIYLNLVLAKFIHLSKKISCVIAYIGNKSFHIMALHFLMFKLVSLLYISFYDKPYYYISKFPTIIDSGWWFIYLFFGIAGSILCTEMYAYIKRKYTLIYAKYYCKGW